MSDESASEDLYAPRPKASFPVLVHVKGINHVEPPVLEIPDTTENWENGRLGRDEKYVGGSDAYGKD